MDAVNLVTEQGRRLAEVGGRLQEVVIATAAEAAAMPIPGLEGVYVVGTGSTGAAQAFITLGSAYFAMIMAGAFAYRVPKEGCVVRHGCDAACAPYSRLRCALQVDSAWVDTTSYCCTSLERRVR